MKRVLVCGGRDYDDREALGRVLARLRRYDGLGVVIHGAARGADRLAGEWARHNGVPEERFPADWGRHGRAAGHLRNQRMLAEGRPDLVVAFPGGAGTADMTRRATRAGVVVYRVADDVFD